MRFVTFEADRQVAQGDPSATPTRTSSPQRAQSHGVIESHDSAAGDHRRNAPNNRRPRYNPNPIIACDEDHALMQEAKKAVHSIRRAYRAAWKEFK